VTLDEALRDPASFFATCGQPVYLSSELLFELNEADISASAPAQLRKLARLMAMRPGTRVRLEGYTDATGTLAINRGLSQRRAQAVADWLFIHSAVTQGDVETVGRADANPIVSDPALYYLNRRVEVSVICGAEGLEP
jgi:outer membrane protein OmpA-like peptidoglycan-associated protein